MEEQEFGSGPFPRAPLLGAIALIGLSLFAAATVRVTGIGASKVPDAPSMEVRDFRFQDRNDGGISVFDAKDGHLVQVVAPGSNGFLRGTLRGLGRERKRQGIDPDKPFRLTGHADGRLTLEDPSTGRRVDLESFGPTNAMVFAQLMNPVVTAR
jgi:putative photosynthetic complex assembly protein